MEEMLQIEDFTPLEGTTFRLRKPDGGEQVLTLESITPISMPPTEKRPRGFSLIFRPPAGERVLEQRMYEMEHAAAGTLAIFLVPIQPDQKGARYEAIFA